MDEKECYIKLDIQGDDGLTLVLIDKFYARVSLCLDDDGEPMCLISGNDDWSLAYFGQDAESKFDALLSSNWSEISYDFITNLGFKFWG
jgi:hypothetical protein